MNFLLDNMSFYGGMIIAQAGLEGLSAITHDSIFKKYGIPILEV